MSYLELLVREKLVTEELEELVVLGWKVGIVTLWVFLRFGSSFVLHFFLV